MRGLKFFGGAAVVVLTGIFVSSSKADTVVQFTAGPVGGLQAQAIFDYDPALQTLTLTLENVGTTGGGAGNLIGALFFKTSGLTLVKPGSAVGADVYNFNTNTDLGSMTIANDWAFGSNLSGSSLGLSGSGFYALSGVGYGVFGPGDIIGDPSLSIAGGGTPPDGPAMMIVPTGYVPNGGMDNASNNPLVVRTATFTFSNIASFNTNTISNVTFQYGTGLGETKLTGTPGGEGGGGDTVAPLPKTAWAGIGLLGMLAAGRFLHGRRQQMA